MRPWSARARSARPSSRCADKRSDSYAKPRNCKVPGFLCLVRTGPAACCFAFGRVQGLRFGLSGRVVPFRQQQMFDCTSFVFLLLARKSPQAASALAAFVDPLRSTCHLRRVQNRCRHLCQARRRAARTNIGSGRVGNLPCADRRLPGPRSASVPRRLRSENHCKPCLGTPQAPPRETTAASGVRQSAGYDPRIGTNLLAGQKFAEPAPQTTAAAHTNIDQMRAEVCDNGIARNTIHSVHRLRKAQPRKTGTALKETERRANALSRKETGTISPLRTRRPRAGCRWRRPADRRHWPAGLRPAHRPHPGPAAGRRCPAKRPAKRR